MPGLEVEDLYQEARLGVVKAWRLRREWSQAERFRRAKLYAASQPRDAALKARRRAGVFVPLTREVATIGEDGLAAVEAAFLLQEVWRAASPGERAALRRACGVAAPTAWPLPGAERAARNRVRARFFNERG